jgi:hypothetical protein
MDLCRIMGRSGITSLGVRSRQMKRVALVEPTMPGSERVVVS